MKKINAIFLALVLLLLTPCAAVSGATGATGATGAAQLDTPLNKTAQYVVETVKQPAVSSIGGEWAILGLARSGYNVPKSYYETYYKAVESYVKERKGVLHDKKYTEYSRVIIGLTAAGYDPRNVAGYDLTAPLGDYEKTIWQGLNGPIWALIALDSGDYAIPKSTGTQATRDLYIDEILRCQLPDGGFNLTAGANGAKIGSGETSDPDLTGMAVQALAKYQDKTKIKQAINKALTRLSKMQDADGGYKSWGNENSESVVQALVALCEAGVSLDDPRFVKNGHTLLENLLSFQNGDGSFNHTGSGSGDSMMATEQALYGMAAANRAAKGESSLYRIITAEKKK
ncbi:MAG: terpene cyclase/mutase family protein [Clostridiales bacterium]|jgi:hypothetical protein|nr:terpene cyclase/mutase family protein [Clostridiales bacterium]